MNTKPYNNFNLNCDGITIHSAYGGTVIFRVHELDGTIYLKPWIESKCRNQDGTFNWGVIRTYIEQVRKAGSHNA